MVVPSFFPLLLFACNAAQGEVCAVPFIDGDSGGRIFYAGTIVPRIRNTSRGSYRVNFHGGRHDYYDIKPAVMHAVQRYLD